MNHTGEASKVKEGTYFSYSHGASNGTNAVADGGQEANFHAIDCLVEFLDLLLLGRFIVPLIGDSRVSLGIDMGSFKWFRHVEGGCGGEYSVFGVIGDGCDNGFSKE